MVVPVTSRSRCDYQDVATVDAGADIADAAATMMKRRVRRLPVVDEDGRIHGLLALDDLVRNLGHQAEDVSDLLRAQLLGVSPEA